MKVKAGTGAWTYRMEYPIVQSDEEKISPKCVRRGLIELSTISNGSTEKMPNENYLKHPYFYITKYNHC